MAQKGIGCFQGLLILGVIGWAASVIVPRASRSETATSQPAQVEVQTPSEPPAQESPTWRPVIEEIIASRGIVKRFNPIISHPFAGSTEITLKIPDLAEEVVYVTQPAIKDYWVLVIGNSILEKDEILPMLTHSYRHDMETGCFTEIASHAGDSPLYNTILNGCPKDFMVMSIEAALEKGVTLEEK